MEHKFESEKVPTKCQNFDSKVYFEFWLGSVHGYTSEQFFFHRRLKIHRRATTDATHRRTHYEAYRGPLDDGECTAARMLK